MYCFLQLRDLYVNTYSRHHDLLILRFPPGGIFGTENLAGGPIFW